MSNQNQTQGILTPEQLDQISGGNNPMPGGGNQTPGGGNQTPGGDDGQPMPGG